MKITSINPFLIKQLLAAVFITSVAYAATATKSGTAGNIETVQVTLSGLPPTEAKFFVRVVATQPWLNDPFPSSGGSARSGRGWRVGQKHGSNESRRMGCSIYDSL